MGGIWDELEFFCKLLSPFFLFLALPSWIPLPNQPQVSVHGKVHKLSGSDKGHPEVSRLLKWYYHLWGPQQNKRCWLVSVRISLTCLCEDGRRNVYPHLPWPCPPLWNRWHEHNNVFNHIGYGMESSYHKYSTMKASQGSKQSMNWCGF